MPDREKVIKGIQECDLNGGLIGNCPYKEIVLLLKEQKQKKVEKRLNGGWCGNCPSCLSPIHRFEFSKETKYCAICGQAVKWE